MIFLILYLTYFFTSFSALVDIANVNAVYLTLIFQTVIYLLMFYLYKSKYNFREVKNNVITESYKPITKRKLFVNYKHWLFLLLVYYANQFIYIGLFRLIHVNQSLLTYAYYYNTILDFIFIFVLLYPIVVESNIGFKKKGILKIIGFALIAYISSLIFNGLYSYLIEILKIVPASGDSSLNQQVITAMVTQTPIRSFMTITFSAAIFEEFVYRGIGFRAILNKNKFLAYFTTFMIFGLVHLMVGFMDGSGLSEFVFLPIYGMMGVIYSYLYEKTESIYTPMLAHFINNFVAFILLLTQV